MRRDTAYIAYPSKSPPQKTCYKQFRQEIIQEIDLKEDGSGFVPEVTAKISQVGVPGL
jgi:hypothetical protein